MRRRTNWKTPRKGNVRKMDWKVRNSEDNNKNGHDGLYR
jgi:hypothetical protein